MKAIIWFVSLILVVGCATPSKSQKLALDKIPKENITVEKEIKTALPQGSLRGLQKEKIAFINIHDFPDSTLLSAKTKMNPPDLALDEAKLLQMERSEILRQTLVTYCDECQNFEVLLPVEKLSENQFNMFFDKIFLHQEIKWSEVSDLAAELGSYDKLVLILSSEDYEKNRGFNKDSDIVAVSETFIHAEVYIFDLKNKSQISRLNLKLSNRDYLFYAKKETAGKQYTTRLKEVKDTKIKTLLNDFRYDDVYPYPMTSESLTLFNFFYSELGKSLFTETE